MKIVGKITLNKLDEKKRKRLKPKVRKVSSPYEISTEMLRAVIDKWEENEAIMNLVQRIRSIEIDNGILKSEIQESKHKNIEKMRDALVMRLEGTIEKLNRRLDERNRTIRNQRDEIKNLRNKI